MNLHRSRSKIRLASVVLFIIGMGINGGVIFAIHLTPDSELLSQANARILKIRRGTISLDFGPSNASKPITIVQRSHGFRFGCNAFQFDFFSTQALEDKYRSLFSALFNYAPLPFFWPIYEPTQGEYPYDTRLHNMTSWLASFNASSKGTPVIWQDPRIVPSWMASLDQDEQRLAALDRIDTVLTQFPEIKSWDLVNEMTHVPNTWLGTTPEATWETAVGRARMDRPGGATEFIANEYTIGDNVAPDRFYQFVSNVAANGFAPDALGFQFHTVEEWFPLEQLISTFDDFGAFKIPCHVTEFIPASNGSYMAGVHPGPITEESQATWAVNAYTMLFSLPALQAITWWDFSSNTWPAWGLTKAPS